MLPWKRRTYNSSKKHTRERACGIKNPLEKTCYENFIEIFVSVSDVCIILYCNCYDLWKLHLHFEKFIKCQLLKDLLSLLVKTLNWDVYTVLKQKRSQKLGFPSFPFYLHFLFGKSNLIKYLDNIQIFYVSRVFVQKKCNDQRCWRFSFLKMFT